MSLISTEFYRYECRSDYESFDVTLFGNGTLRLREGPHDRRNLLLLELDPVQLQDVVARLENLDLTDVQSFGGDLDGEWLGQCKLMLGVPERPPARLVFHQFDTLSLELRRAVGIGEELSQTIRERAPFRGLPRDYEATIGDYLRRTDGEVFEVMGFSADDRALELAALEQPIIIYVAVESLHEVFVDLLPERP